jgi:hypothetical protein
MAEESKENENLYTTDQLLQSLLQPIGEPGRAVAFYAANLADQSVIDALNAERFAELHIARGSVDAHSFSLVDVVREGEREVPHYRVLFLLASLRDQLELGSRHKTLANAISGDGFDLCDGDSIKEAFGKSAETLGKSLFRMSAEALHQMTGGRG